MGCRCRCALPVFICKITLASGNSGLCEVWVRCYTSCKSRGVELLMNFICMTGRLNLLPEAIVLSLSRSCRQTLISIYSIELKTQSAALRLHEVFCL